LRIRNEKWLIKQFPILIIRPKPTVKQDRQKITAIFDEENILASNRNRAITRSSAGMRANVRDKSWLFKQLNKLKNEQKEFANKSRKDITEQRAARIMSALQKLLQADERPTRIFAGKLAAIAGLTQNQTSAVVRANQPLRNAINAANDDKFRRLLQWATAQQIANHQPLSMNRICTLAGLPKSALASTLIEQIITNLLKP
jgi:hypothetical protein